MAQIKPKQRVDRRSYKSVVKALSETHPTTTSFLRRAEVNRTRRLKYWQHSGRMQGYEELISHLTEVGQVYRRNRRLRPIAFLIDRAQADFVTGLEATLSGFHSVAHDAMREVMEIEFLLREFYHEPDRIQEWLKASPKQQNDKFRPAILRQRHAARHNVKPENLVEANDYRSHSLYLHVTTAKNPFGGPGISDEDIAFSADSGFWEIFEHGRRVLFTIHWLRRKIAPHLRSPWGPKRGLRKVRAAWHATQNSQVIYHALMKVMREEFDEDST